MRLEIKTRVNGDVIEVETTLLEGPADLVEYGTAVSALGLEVVKHMIKFGGWSKAEAIEKATSAFATSLLEVLEGEAAEQPAQESE